VNISACAHDKTFRLSLYLGEGKKLKVYAPAVEIGCLFTATPVFDLTKD
jgi:hypothetical protein